MKIEFVRWANISRFRATPVHPNYPLSTTSHDGIRPLGWIMAAFRMDPAVDRALRVQVDAVVKEVLDCSRGEAPFPLSYCVAGGAVRSSGIDLSKQRHYSVGMLRNIITYWMAIAGLTLLLLAALDATAYASVLLRLLMVRS